MLNCACCHTHYERSFSMSNQHKHPTISFRISDAERKQIEARILASGMMKKITLSVPASITASALSARKKLYIRLCRLLMLCICNYLKCRKHLPHQTALPILFLRQKPLRTYISNTLICLQLLSTCWMVQNICGKETVMNNNLNFSIRYVRTRHRLHYRQHR